MALNFFAMFASLRMGVDVMTTTDASEVPHVLQPGYVPVYTGRDDSGVIVFQGIPVDELVEQLHGDLRELTLYEDNYPVFTVS